MRKKVTQTPRRAAEALVGGHPALDFLNTVDDQGKTRSLSRIAALDALGDWAAEAGALSTEELSALSGFTDDAEAAAMLAEIHALREAAYASLSALAAGAAPPPDATAALERRIKQALARASLSLATERPGWICGGDGSERIVDALALSLESLLRSGELGRLKECGRCTWLFLDHGRGRGRRWCAMSACGNRAKAETFRRR